MSLNLSNPITFTNTSFISQVTTDTSLLNQPAIVVFDTFPENNTEDRNLFGAAGANHLVKAMTAGSNGIFSDLTGSSYYIFGRIAKLSNMYYGSVTTGTETVTPQDGDITYTDPGIYVAYLLPTPESSINVSGLTGSNRIFVYNSYPTDITSQSSTELIGESSGAMFTYDMYYYLLYPINYIYGPITNGVANLNSLYGGNDISMSGDIMTAIPGNYILFNFRPVCFLKGTPVETDQGEVEIDKLVPDINTINGKRIIKVVETYGNPTCLRLIKKDLISSDVPNKDTVITKWHKVLFNGKLIMAKDLPGIHVCQYNGEALYNVLMDEHDMMKVNGMTVETLDPANKINK
jgi:hypothetical protein